MPCHGALAWPGVEGFLASSCLSECQGVRACMSRAQQEAAGLPGPQGTGISAQVSPGLLKSHGQGEKCQNGDHKTGPQPDSLDATTHEHNGPPTALIHSAGPGALLSGAADSPQLS